MYINRSINIYTGKYPLRLHVRAAKPGLEPLLIICNGLGEPYSILAQKLEKHLDLDQKFAIVYFEPRGCGDSNLEEALSVDFSTQINDVDEVCRWVANYFRIPPIVIALSLGATFTLLAYKIFPKTIRKIIAISPLLNAGYCYNFLRTAKHKPFAFSTPHLHRGLLQNKQKSFLIQQMQCGKSISSMVKHYGFWGTYRAMRNAKIILRRLIPSVEKINLSTSSVLTDPNIYYLFGGQDRLTPMHQINGLSIKPENIYCSPQAGHFVFYEDPTILRLLIEKLCYA